MSSLVLRFAKLLRAPSPVIMPTSSLGVGLQRSLRSCYSTVSFNSDNEEGRNDKVEEEFDDLLGDRRESRFQGVDPRKGWEFRGVHRAIICGKVGQSPVQKILRNGRTVTIFTVGTGGMFDQRIIGSKDLPKPAQWHRIAVHNDSLGAYAVQQLAKNSSVYVEGDIEIRVYNDSISGEVKNIPEICVRRDGKIRLIRSGESISNISFEDLNTAQGHCLFLVGQYASWIGISDNAMQCSLHLAVRLLPSLGLFPLLFLNSRVKMMFLVVFLLTLLSHVPALDACPKCGNMLVPYPLSTSDNCGNPRYRIYCNNGALEFLSAQGLYYRILSINPSAYKLVIRPPLIGKDTCYSSDLAEGGLRLDENLPFNISVRNTVMLFNCSDNLLLSPLNCSSTSYCRQYEEIEEGSACKGTLCCHFLKDASMTSHMIRVRVGGCTAYTSVVDIKPADPVGKWNYGIELQWMPPF
ncbi:hypothetical protein NC653_030333 [Populus alba x Populus x berolinensis]|uniref:Wall-associated receptor kinase galacturonan-binding domain-containing protein n=2 Tax=Populus alba x Populus x berolinensis TaxID=444605 RepID=A0AAD6Q1Y4_9ROSI|nr:hypothetical protein NC653_030333 [Populus alba x Populus x berolinensis]